LPSFICQKKEKEKKVNSHQMFIKITKNHQIEILLQSSFPSKELCWHLGHINRTCCIPTILLAIFNCQVSKNAAHKHFYTIHDG